MKKKRKRHDEITLMDVDSLMCNLLGDYYNPHYISCEDPGDNSMSDSDIFRTDGLLWQDYDFDDPFFELFIWSLLNTQQEMAKLFWRCGEDVIAAALIATALFYSMSNHTDNPCVRQQLEANADEFTNLAIGVLKECHNSDASKTQQLLTRRVIQLRETSCILIALNAKIKNFLSQTACQDLFNNIWKGQLTQENGIIKLLICTLIPPLILPLVTFKENEDGEHTVDNATSIKEKFEPKLISKQKSHPSVQLEGRKADTEDKTEVDVKYCSKAWKVSHFYQAPVVVFCLNVISYITFLCLYSYILICKLEPKLSLEEYPMFAFVLAIFIEEIKQVYTSPATTLITKLKCYIKSFWNKLDIIMIFLFVVGMSLRAIDEPHAFAATRIILGCNLVTFFVRLLHIFSAHKVLGPKLMIIIYMVVDLAYFVLILLVFIAAYAIASHAILYPNTQLNLDTFIAIFGRPYWNIYGELMLETIEGAEDCTNDAELYMNGTYSRCPTVYGKYVVLVLMGLYMLMCNILLMNLLIAMFSSTFKKVQADSHIIWCFQQCSLINEYINRPRLPPPLNIAMYLSQLISFVLKRMSRCFEDKRSPKINPLLCDIIDNEFIEWEYDNVDNFLRQKDLGDQIVSNSKQLPDLHVNQLMKKICKLQKEQQALMGDVRSQNEITNKRLETIEKQLLRIIESPFRSQTLNP